jgi:hypothetical protein
MVEIVTMVIEIVGGMIDHAFALVDNSILQEWANDVIFKEAERSQDVAITQLSETPELIPKDSFELDYFE